MRYLCPTTLVLVVPILCALAGCPNPPILDQPTITVTVNASTPVVYMEAKYIDDDFTVVMVDESTGPLSPGESSTFSLAYEGRCVFLAYAEWDRPGLRLIARYPRNDATLVDQNSHFEWVITDPE